MVAPVRDLAVSDRDDGDKVAEKCAIALVGLRRPGERPSILATDCVRRRGCGAVTARARCGVQLHELDGFGVASAAAMAQVAAGRKSG